MLMLQHADPFVSTIALQLVWLCLFEWVSFDSCTSMFVGWLEKASWTLR